MSKTCRVISHRFLVALYAAQLIGPCLSVVVVFLFVVRVASNLDTFSRIRLVVSDFEQGRRGHRCHFVIL